MLLRLKAAVLLPLLMLAGCTPEEPETTPLVLLKGGGTYTADGSAVAPGGTLRFGLSVSGGGGAITNLVVRRISDGVAVTEADRGMYISYGGLDTTLTYTRGYGLVEKWVFSVMNSHRDTASASLTVLRGAGSAWGEISYHPSIRIGLQENSSLPHFVDLHTGAAYDAAGVAGHEAEVDMAAFWYLTSGTSSPTLTCPAYSSALTYYPLFGSWSVKNQTMYDYYTSDNDLVTPAQFELAANDSLLVNAYRPGSVSGQSKFAYTGKVVPFRTADGKYGLMRVIRADETPSGEMEIAVKIQK
ncbi:MAG: hypothetical protein RBT50_07010 [Bacteroidales bacterium]|jgi:hypothetical protein|nr:hypothetical protein [Bacteroidales bacterium]